jgi:hypothetical protein
MISFISIAPAMTSYFKSFFLAGCTISLRGTFFKNRTKSKIGKKNIYGFYIFDFIFGFLILKLVNE